MEATKKPMREKFNYPEWNIFDQDERRFHDHSILKEIFTNPSLIQEFL